MPRPAFTTPLLLPSLSSKTTTTTSTSFLQRRQLFSSTRPTMLGTATGGGGGLGQFLERVWNNFANVEKGIGEVGRSRTRMQVAEKHAVLGTPLDGPFPGKKMAMFGLGCFWGAERKFWKIPGVYSTSVGYAGGQTKNPTYREVCGGRTGHAEVVRVVYDDKKVDYESLLDVFWDAHNPTTKNRQGNDVGTQYRSVIFVYDEEQKKLAEMTKKRFDGILKEKGVGRVVTEIDQAPEYWFAEDYHQQYLEKNPRGYCGLGGTGLYQAREREAMSREKVADC